MVREARLELAHLAAPEPKSGASTNFATPATTWRKKDSLCESLFQNMAGIPGFEPGNARIKTWCLTAWRYPKKWWL
ncbi:hypothetical protein K151_441 [Proteus hauseri ZMd44]|nr:hypothetical protein K151_441 [Proteus hauseri ZMd44]